jgi:hypothetical protein
MALTATAGIARILQLLPVQAVRTGHHCVQNTPVPGHSPPAKLHVDSAPCWATSLRPSAYVDPTMEEDGATVRM